MPDLVDLDEARRAREARKPKPSPARVPIDDRFAEMEAQISDLQSALITTIAMVTDLTARLYKPSNR